MKCKVFCLSEIKGVGTSVVLNVQYVQKVNTVSEQEIKVTGKAAFKPVRY